MLGWADRQDVRGGQTGRMYGWGNRQDVRVWITNVKLSYSTVTKWMRVESYKYLGFEFHATISLALKAAISPVRDRDSL